MTTPDPPIILLLFANDRSDGQYLRNLPAEAERLEQTLARLGERVRVITKANITQRGLLRLLRRHARQTIGVHFGGHAHPDALYIEDDAGAPVELNVAGLANWFARMPRLRWAFLNGCATRDHVETIHRSRPVPVIATERAICDDAAVAFADEFYACLAESWTIAESFAAARDALTFTGGDGAHRFLRPGSEPESTGPPWRLAMPPDDGASRWTLRTEWLGAAETAAVDQTSPAAPAAPLETLRAHLEAAHASLVPFFQPEHGTAFIREVYVELQIHCDPRRRARSDAEADAAEADAAEADAADAISDGPRRVTLEGLMAGDDDLPSHGRWAVLGDPGAGKSTLARHLVWQNATTADPPLTLYVGLADFAEFQGDPFDFVQDQVAQGAGAAADGIADALRGLAADEDRLWIIFDGLDEVAPDRLNTARQQIEAFGQRWPGVAIVVCSRPIGYETLVGFSPARVQPLDRQQQRHLLDGWLGEAAAAQALTRIHGEAALHDAAGNPLLLSLMAKLASEAPNRALPASRGGLYGAALSLLLARGHSPAKRGLGPQTSSARRLLSILSVALTEAGKEAWRRRAVEKALLAAARGDVDDQDRLTGGEWKDAGGFLDWVAHDTGILAAHDGPAGRWRYLHRSLRERLAAEALADEGAEAIIARIRAVADDEDQLGRWGETLGMACGLLDDPAAPLRALRDVDEALTLRVLPELSGLRPAVALDVLFGIEPRIEFFNHIWDGETLHRLACKWPLDEAVTELMARVTPTLDLDRLAFVHHALTALGRPPARAAFFAAAGRPIDAAPHIPWVPIRPGVFRMGEPGEAVAVHITATFEMAATPVTVGQYRAFDPEHRCRGGVEHPATAVSWWRAWLFAAWVGAALPTEAQWEYACRAGTTTRFWSGDDAADLDRVGWYGRNSGNQAHPVARKPANPWGLCDVHGNVDEWCLDGHGPAPDAGADGAPLADPARPPTGVQRVLRGGSCIVSAGVCRSAQRLARGPGLRLDVIGFRLARPAPAL